MPQLVTEIVEDGLRRQLVPPAKPWMECFGELSDLREESERINRIIEDEFEQIDPEMWT